MHHMVPLIVNYSRLVSSVGRATVCCAGGRRFKPQTGPTLTRGLKITEEGEYAAFVIISANG